MVTQRTKSTIYWQSFFALIFLCMPAFALYWLLSHPRQNVEIIVPLEHFLVVTNVSAIALIVALLLARASMHIRQYRVFFLSLGFMSMAGFFLVHALATPGIVVMGQVHDYGGTVIGVSAYLSLFVPSMFFVARNSSLPVFLEQRFMFRPIILFLAVVEFLLAYGASSLLKPNMIGGLPISSPPFVYILASITILLLSIAAWHEARACLEAGLPPLSATAMAFVFLAEAQVSMLLAPTWTLAWWEYHMLMLVAVAVALWGIFVDLDRRRGLERFLPSVVVNRVLAGDPIPMSGERRVVTVLFADLRNSTALAEKLPAEAVVEVLNAYVGGMARSVFAHGGMLDKFLGDGVMAVFGVTDQTNGAVDAARAALDIRKTLNIVNATYDARLGGPVGFGVGVHTGEVVLGAVGIPERSDFTAIGDTVNTAARLEEMTKLYKVDIVVSAKTVEHLGNGEFELRLLEEAQIRGKTEFISLYTIV